MSGSWTHFTLDRRSLAYWVTFDHPPINPITATTIAEKAEAMETISTQRSQRP
jgi:uncharacterized protein YqjF (DUF2071 family)